MDDELKKAIAAGIRILSYSAYTERQVIEKLKQKGFRMAQIQEAIEYLKEKGCINDQSLIENAILKLADRKLYGKHRIRMELVRMGFSSEMIREADFSEVDFHANCCKAIEKRGDPSEFEDKDKAYIRNLGYSSDEIRTALKELKELREK